MKLSVLIPVYNYRCYTLVSDLHKQLEQSGVTYEILVAEDGSKDQVRIISNRRINELSHCRHIIRRENAGRSAIRNFLAQEAQGEWLLFADSDGKVISDAFVENYLQAIAPQVQSEAGPVHVVCGGLVHADACPSPMHSLRWRYEKAYEQMNGNKDPHFRSFCFMIRHSVFDEIQFDESYTLYGHEDVQFGIELRKRGYSITNISNPLQNGDIETNPVFLKKTEEAVRTTRIHRDSLRGEVHIIEFAEKAPVKYLSWLLKPLFRITKPLLRRNLLGNNPNLKVFALYKLGYYLTLP